MAKKTKDTQIRDKIIEAALALAVSHGWSNVSLRDVAEQADISIAELFAHVDDRDDILVLLGKTIDRQVLENMDEPDDASSVRDRLFDVMMERYDVLNNYREGILAILEDFKYDPKQMVISMPFLCKSMSWMLEACGVETSGIKGAMRVVGLSGIYLKVLWCWAEDESADLSQTMAALDKALDRVENVADVLGL